MRCRRFILQKASKSLTGSIFTIGELFTQSGVRIFSLQSSVSLDTTGAHAPQALPLEPDRGGGDVAGKTAEVAGWPGCVLGHPLDAVAGGSTRLISRCFDLVRYADLTLGLSCITLKNLGLL